MDPSDPSYVLIFLVAVISATIGFAVAGGAELIEDGLSVGDAAGVVGNAVLDAVTTCFGLFC